MRAAKVMRATVVWYGGAVALVTIALFYFFVHGNNIDVSHSQVRAPGGELHSGSNNGKSRVSEQMVNVDEAPLSFSPSIVGESLDADDTEGGVYSDDNAKLTVEQQELYRQYFDQQLRPPYAMLFRDLGIDEDVQESLVTLLIEEHTTENDRALRLEEVLGHELAREFLALEKDLPSYTAVSQVETVLADRGLQLSESQADKFFETHVDILENYESALIEGEIPEIELAALEMADKMRLITERIPAFMSSQQVGVLAAYYDDLTRRRVQSMEQQVSESGEPPVSFPAY